VLFSVHLKATMMKVSDPIIFGHVVRAFFPRCSPSTATRSPSRHRPNDGLGALLEASTLADGRRAIEAAVRAGLADGPPLAMVDSDRGITNLHVPSDSIVDASMPAMIRTSGHMWGPTARRPTRSRSSRQQLRRHLPGRHRRLPRARRLRPATMGSVPNVGLMAQAAEEYGSHDKTFEIPPTGTVRVVDSRRTRARARGRAGDIWRMCQTKDVPIRDWVKLAVTRARATGAPACSGSTRTAPTTPT
jgi:isocitrate dehydrogenase